VVLLVDPGNYTPAPTKITNPALDAGVIASTQYPSTVPPASSSAVENGVSRSRVTRSILARTTGLNDPAVVRVESDGLRLKISRINGKWQSAEVHLLDSLGYGRTRCGSAHGSTSWSKNTVAARCSSMPLPGRSSTTSTAEPAV